MMNRATWLSILALGVIGVLLLAGLFSCQSQLTPKHREVVRNLMHEADLLEQGCSATGAFPSHVSFKAAIRELGELPDQQAAEEVRTAAARFAFATMDLSIAIDMYRMHKLENQADRWNTFVESSNRCGLAKRKLFDVCEQLLAEESGQ